MAGWATVAQIGMSFLSDRQNAKAADMEAEEKRRVQQYMNTMRALSSASNQNAISTNEVMAVQESAVVAMNIQKNAIRSKGAARVQAATAGVEGESVTDVIRGMSRSAAQAETLRRMDLKAKLVQFDNQREQDVTAANAGMGVSVFSGGDSMFTSLLGAAGKGLSAYQDGKFEGIFGSSKKKVGPTGFDYGNDGL